MLKRNLSQLLETRAAALASGEEKYEEPAVALPRRVLPDSLPRTMSPPEPVAIRRWLAPLEHKASWACAESGCESCRERSRQLDAKMMQYSTRPGGYLLASND